MAQGDLITTAGGDLCLIGEDLAVEGPSGAPCVCGGPGTINCCPSVPARPGDVVGHLGLRQCVAPPFGGLPVRVRFSHTTTMHRYRQYCAGGGSNLPCESTYDESKTTEYDFLSCSPFQQPNQPRCEWHEGVRDSMPPGIMLRQQNPGNPCAQQGVGAFVDLSYSLELRRIEHRIPYVDEPGFFDFFADGPLNDPGGASYFSIMPPFLHFRMEQNMGWDAEVLGRVDFYMSLQPLTQTRTPTESSRIWLQRPSVQSSSRRISSGISATPTGFRPVNEGRFITGLRGSANTAWEKDVRDPCEGLFADFEAFLTTEFQIDIDLDLDLGICPGGEQVNSPIVVKPGLLSGPPIDPRLIAAAEDQIRRVGAGGCSNC